MFLDVLDIAAALMTIWLTSGTARCALFLKSQQARISNTDGHPTTLA